MASERTKPKFLKPVDDDYNWEDEKQEVDPISNTTFIYNQYFSLSLEQQRKRLPIFKNRDHIIYLLEKYQVLVLIGSTGCGKSTQVPQYLLEAGWGSEDGKKIVITQPRRVAAISLAARVSDEMGDILGRKVGYAMRFKEKFDSTSTKILYMTEGLLLREMMGDPLLRQYCVIILDEVHERTLNSDLLMCLLRKITQKRPDLKVIISSATVDGEEIQKFFNLRKSRSMHEKNTSVVMSVSGYTYSTEIFYVQEPVADYVKESVETAVKIHRSETPGDILIFLTGQDEVDKAVSLLETHAKELKGKHPLDLLPLPMYGSLPANSQLQVFRPTSKETRKIVVATNIAETSITISGIVHVIDCGFVKMRWFNAETFSDSLVVVPTSKASAIQRAGRAGRTQAGKVYRLYKESDYENMTATSPPEIQRSDISLAVLQLKALGISNIARFHYVCPPPAKNLVSAVELLFAVGALDMHGNLSVPLGEQMAEFPLNPCFSKMLLSSGEFGCSEEITTIVALLQVENIFQVPYGAAAMKARVAKRNFETNEGDLLTLLNVYMAYIKNGSSQNFCYKNFLSHKRLKRAVEIKKQLTKMIMRFNVPIVSCNGDTEAVLKCITSGLFSNAAYLHHSGEYHTVRGDITVHVHPTSVLYTLPQPQWILFAEIIHLNQVYMRYLTVIKPQWLQQLVPHFYQMSTYIE